MVKLSKDKMSFPLLNHPAIKKIDGLLQLRRITTSGTYIPEIDGLRFVAILAVVLFHVPIQISLRSESQILSNPFWHIISHGDRGVQLFFVISGFILGMPFAAHVLNGRKAVQLRSYFLRRITRLEPPYILAILIRIPLITFVLHKAFRDTFVHAIATLFYVHSKVFGKMSTVNPPAWSLEVEIQFYILAPLLALSYFSIRPTSLRRISGFAFLLLADLIQEHFLSSELTRWTLSILDFIQYFFAGFLLCYFYLTDWKKIPSHWLWDVVSAASWAWIFAADGESVHVLLPAITLVAYLAAFKGRLFNSFFRLSWVSITGGMCYSLYLTHNLAITGVDIFLHRYTSLWNISSWQRVALAYALAIPAVMTAGLILYVFIERPCMDKSWPQKLYCWLRPASVQA